MPAITASMVGELRAKTDAPMMECKKALTEADGNMERAEELLRIKLGSKAGKAASRITAEGVITSAVGRATGGGPSFHPFGMTTAGNPVCASAGLAVLEDGPGVEPGAVVPVLLI